MSLLAGTRKKQIISANPQGKNAASEWQQFGSKLMGKYGWQPGDGLGTERRGETEIIQATFRNDNRGLGCSVQHENNWLAHNDDFNDILSSLGQSYSATEKSEEPVSRNAMPLEAKSKSSKGRIHYHKFARGKDLSCRSKEDISSIFGGRMPSPSVSTEIHTEDTNNSDLVGLEDKRCITGLHTTTSSDNIQKYFEKKLKEKKRKQTTYTDGNAFNDNVGSENENGATSQGCASLKDVETVPGETPAADDAKRKKRKRKTTETSAEPPVAEIAESGVSLSKGDSPFKSGIDECYSIQEQESLVEISNSVRKKQKSEEEIVLDNIVDLETLAVSEDIAGPMENGIPDDKAGMHSVQEAATISEEISRSAEGDEVKETTTVVKSFVRTTYGLSMESVRRHFRSLPDEVKANLFPGSNVFRIVGYGNELLH